MKNIVGIILLFIYTGAFALKPVDSIGVEQYSGVWYEIARYDNSLQKNCIHTRIIYENNKDNFFNITTQCLRSDNTFKSAFAKAYVLGERPSKLGLQYYFKWIKLNLLQQEQWIIKKTENYMIISSPAKDKLWVLSRGKVIDPILLVDILKWVQGQGFGLREMIIDNNKIDVEWPD